MSEVELIDENRIWIIIKKGVYIQGIAGIFDDQEIAMKAAKKAYEHEPDDYHDFYILGKVLNQEGKYTYDDWEYGVAFKFESLDMDHDEAEKFIKEHTADNDVYISSQEIKYGIKRGK